LFRFIDWLLALPADREVALRQVIMTWEEERKMPYVTSIERIGRAEGREEGRKEGREEGRELVRRAVLRRFGSLPPSLEERIAAANREELLALFDRALDAATLDAI
jgi:flagellar biosynthesis/type III secretory pathway protein FliH